MVLMFLYHIGFIHVNMQGTERLGMGVAVHEGDTVVVVGGWVHPGVGNLLLDNLRLKTLQNKLIYQ